MVPEFVKLRVLDVPNTSFPVLIDIEPLFMTFVASIVGGSTILPLLTQVASVALIKVVANNPRNKTVPNKRFIIGRSRFKWFSRYGFIVSAYGLSTVRDDESVILTTISNMPEFAGIPEITPVELRLNPDGRAPLPGAIANE